MRLPALRLSHPVVTPLARRMAFALASFFLLPASSFAAQWMDVATISSTLTNTAGRLCIGGGRTDIGCPTNAPFLDTAAGLLTVPGDLRVSGNLYVSGSQSFDGVTFSNGGVSATGTVTATSFYGNGSGLTGVAANWYGIPNIPLPVQAVSNGTAISMAGISATNISVTNNLTVGGALTAGSAGFGTLAASSISATTGRIANDFYVGGNFYVSGSQSIDGVSFANGGVSATGTVTATQFSGNGSGITGINFSANPVDRIVSGTYGVYVSSTGLVTANNNVSVTGNLSAANLAASTGSFSAIATNSTSSTLVNASNISATYIDATQSGTVSATNGYFTNISGTNISGKFVGDGSGLTGVTAASADRIISGTAQMIANGNTNSISITEAGVTTGYYYNGIWVAKGISTTGPISATEGYFSNAKITLGAATPITYAASDLSTPGHLKAQYSVGIRGNRGTVYGMDNGTGGGLSLFSNSIEALTIKTTGNVGILTTAPSTTLHVSGTIRIANGGETCDTNRSGAIRYVANNFQVCYGTGGWANLADASSTVATADRITSGTAQVIANGNSNSISITEAGVTTGYYYGGVWVAGGVSTTGAISATSGYITNQLGIGVTPSTALEVKGTVSSSALYVGNSNNYILGNLSVGSTTTPGVKLDVVGGGRFYSPSANTQLSIGRSGDSIYYNSLAIYSGYNANPSTLLSQDSVGNYLKAYRYRYDISVGATTPTAIITALAIGRAGISNTDPSVTLDVGGSLRVANSGETCDTNRTGAIRYVANNFQVCYGTGGWANLADASSTVATADRITSGTAQVIANGTTNSISITEAGVTTGYYYNGIWVAGGVSTTGTVSSSGLYVTGTSVFVGNATMRGFFNLAYNNSLFIGNSAGSNTDYTTSIGANAGQYNTGQYSTILGGLAGRNNAAGAVALFGYQAGQNNTGANTVAIGYSAASANTGALLTAVGYSAAQYNGGLRNVAVGAYTLQYKGGGSDNVALGYGAGLGVTNTTTFSGGTLLGSSAGTSLTTGNSNTLVGSFAGSSITSGNSNIAIGSGVSPYSNTGSNQLNIGNALYGDIGSGANNANKIGINVPSPTTALEVSGTISATILSGKFVGDGSGLTGVIAAGSDRITSGTAQMIANGNTNSISITEAGVTTGYYYGGKWVAGGVSTTGVISASGLYVTGTVNVFGNTIFTNGYTTFNSSQVYFATIGGTQRGYIDNQNNIFNWYGPISTATIRASNGTTSAPSYNFAAEQTTGLSRPVAGAIGFSTSGSEVVRINNVATSSITLEVSGSIRTSSWTYINGNKAPTAPLEVSGTVSATNFTGSFTGDGSGLTGVIAAGSDRITSGTAQMIANGNTNSISITESGVTTGYYYGGIWVAGGVSATGKISATNLYVSNSIGIGTTSPAYMLDISNSTGVAARVGNGSTSINLSSNQIYSVGGPLYLNYSGNNNVILTRGGGNVGISTTTPAAPLDIYVNNNSEGLRITRATAPSQYLSLNEGSYLSHNIDAYGNKSLYITNYASTAAALQDSAIQFRVSGTINTMNLSRWGTVGIGDTAAGFLSNPASTTLQIAGSVRLGSETSTTLNTCDTNRAGAIRYVANNFQVCYGTGGWANLADASSTVATADRITSGTAQVIANGTTNSISITESGVTTGYYYNGIWVAKGVSTTGGISGTTGYFNSTVGIGGSLPPSNTYRQLAIRNPNSAQELNFGSVADTVGSFIGNNAYYNVSFMYTPTNTASSGINFRQDGSTEFWNNTGLTAGTDFAPSKTMVLTNTGRVGIGTTSPQGALDISSTNGVIFLRGQNPTLALMGDANSYYPSISWNTLNTTGGPTLRAYGNTRLQLSISGSYITDFNANGVAIGKNGTAPTTMLDVSGTLRIANGGETCDTNRSGAIRYNGSTFQVCYGTGGWANLADASSTVATADRITSGTAQVIANGTTNSISITESGVTTGYYYGGVWVVAGVSTTGTISATNGYISNSLGIGTSPVSSSMLTISSSGFTGGNHNLINVNNALGNQLFNVYETANGNGFMRLYTASGVANVQIAASGGANSYFSTGSNLGINTSTPSQTLHVKGTVLTTSWTGINFSGTNVTPSAPLEVSGTVSATQFVGKFVGDGSGLTGLSAGDNITSGTTNVTASNNSSVTVTTGGSQSMVIGADGRVDISNSGLTNRNARLNLGNALEPKIQLYASNGTSMYGLGMSTNQMNYVVTSVASHVFYGSGVNNNGVELLRINGSGASSTTLAVAGATRITSWTYINGTASNTAPLEVSGTVSATNFVGKFSGDGSGLTGVIAAGSDRITSGTAQMIANGNTNSISITESGVTTGYYYGGVWVAGGVSTTGAISATAGYFAGPVTIAKPYYSTGLTVNFDSTTSNGKPPVSLIQSASSLGLSTLFISRGRVDGTAGIAMETTGVSNTSSTPGWFAGLKATPTNLYNYSIAEISGTSVGTSGNGQTLTDRLTILAGGKVGIGTTTPTTQLEVSGTISGTIITGKFIGDGSGLTGAGVSTFASLTDVYVSTTSGNLYGPTSIGSISSGKPNNTAFGISAMPGLSGGFGFNSVYGYRSGYGLTTGYGNTAMGANALVSTTTGGVNTAIGYAALNANVGGAENTAVGSSALTANTSGGANAAFGSNALIGNTTGSSNTAIGYDALFGNTSGNYNTALGYIPLLKNTTGANNLAMGVATMQENLTGNSNTVAGFNTMLKNTNGSNNAVFGANALRSATSGSNNAVLGASAAYGAAGTLNANSIVGAIAGSNLSTASSNTLLGYAAGNSLTTGSANIMLGLGADAQSATGSWQLNIGNAIYGNIGSGTGLANLIGINVTSPTANLEISGTISATAFATPILTLQGVSGSAGVSLTATSPGDNLGNHTATQNLVMSGFSITSVTVISATGNIQTSAAMQLGNTDTTCSTTADYGKMRFDTTTKKLFLCRP